MSGKWKPEDSQRPLPCFIEVSPEKETEQQSCRDSLDRWAACRLCRELGVTAFLSYHPWRAGFAMMLLLFCTISPPETPDPYSC